MSVRIWRMALTCVAGFAVVTAAQDDASDYIHYRLGVKYKQERNYDQALQAFRKVLAAYPDNYNAYLHIGDIHREQKQYQLAIYDLKKALTYNPGWGRAHRMLAGVYEANGQLPKAIEELQIYQQACDPAERDSLQGEIDRLVSRSTGRPGSGSASAAASVPPPPSSSAAVEAAIPSVRRTFPPVNSARAEEEFRAGVELYGQKSYDQALERLRACLRADPGHGGAFYYAGLIRRRWKQNELAKINFSKALAYPDLGYNAHFYLGKIYGEEGNYPLAVKHLSAYVKVTTYEKGKQEAITLLQRYGAGAPGAVAAGEESPESAVNPEDETAAEVERGRDESPLAPVEVRLDSLLSMAVVDTLSEPGRALLKGVRLFQQGAFDDAITEFKKVQIAYAGNPDLMAHCSYNMGICYFKLRLFDKAENQFQQVLDRRSDHRLAPNSQYFKALTFAERGESATAEKLLRAFIQQNRQHAWVGKAYERLGDVYADLEQPRQAADAYTQAAASSAEPVDRVVSLYKLGIVLRSLGNAPRAEDAFRKAIDAGESRGVVLRVPDAYYQIADGQYQRKEFAKALEGYTAATRKYPAFQETPWGLFQIGNIHRNQKRYREAIDAYKNLMATFPEDYWARQAKWKMEDTIWEHEYRAVLR